MIIMIMIIMDAASWGRECLLSGHSLKASICDGMWCISAHDMGSLLILEGTINAAWYAQILQQHVLHN